MPSACFKIKLPRHKEPSFSPFLFFQSFLRNFAEIITGETILRKYVGHVMPCRNILRQL